MIFLSEAVLFYLLAGNAFLVCFFYGVHIIFHGGMKSAQQWKDHPMKRGLTISLTEKRYPQVCPDGFVAAGWVRTLFLMALSSIYHDRGLHHAAMGMFLLAVACVIFAVIVNGIFCRP